MTKSADTKHTPGPWEQFDGTEIWGTGTHSGVMIADTRLEGVNPDRARADARLIAAAPELLAALEDIADSNNLEGYILPRARAAIARARGDL